MDIETLRYRQRGGLIRAAAQKQAALEARIVYNASPNHCLSCDTSLLVSLTDLRRSVFQTVKRKKFCSHACAASYNNNRKGTGKQKAVRTPRTIKFAKLILFTKEEVFTRWKTWQSARSSIRRHAVYVFEQSGKSKLCAVCSYTHHTDVCHKKPVKEFPGTALVSEINHPDNLISLCPTHHWELDHGLLNLVSAEGLEPSIPAL